MLATPMKNEINELINYVTEFTEFNIRNIFRILC